MRHRQTAAFREGQRVVFEERLERNPHFTIPAGATGTVDYSDDHLLTITIDEPMAELAPWDNQVDFHKEDLDVAFSILRVRTDD
jgi:hypothetical protein